MAVQGRDGLAFFRNFGFSLSEACDRGCCRDKQELIRLVAADQYTLFKKIMVLCPLTSRERVLTAFHHAELTVPVDYLTNPD
jgi:hypothetical protein